MTNSPHTARSTFVDEWKFVYEKDLLKVANDNDRIPKFARSKFTVFWRDDKRNVVRKKRSAYVIRPNGRIGIH